METIIIIGLICLFTLGAMILLHKFKSANEMSPIFKSAVCLVNRYYTHDNGVQEDLQDRPVEIALERGQELLWEQSEEFNKIMPKVLISNSISEKDMDKLFSIAVAIVKTATLMHMIHTTQKPLQGRMSLLIKLEPTDVSTEGHI